jgi:hypothetical protein
MFTYLLGQWDSFFSRFGGSVGGAGAQRLSAVRAENVTTSSQSTSQLQQSTQKQT